MRTTLVLAGILAALVASPALADAPPSGYGPRAHRAPLVQHRAHPRSLHAPRWGHRRGHHHHGGYQAGPSYGGLPPFYPHTGGAAAGLAGQPVGLTLYREAYIGRGLIYNTPPIVSGASRVLSVRY